MFFNFFKSKKNCLGVDLGTAAVKIVELSRAKKRGLVLENYGLTEPKEAIAFRTTNLSSGELGSLIRRVIEEMRPKTKKAVISLPVASSFSTLVELPTMDENELAAAIPFEAKKFIPIPLEEVELDWSVVESTTKLRKEYESTKDDAERSTSNQSSPAPLSGASSDGTGQAGENLPESRARSGTTLSKPRSPDAPAHSRVYSKEGADVNNETMEQLNNEGRGKPIVDQIKTQPQREQRSPKEKTGKTLVLLVAVPKEVIKKYAEVAEIAGLNLLALEQEAFSLARALVGTRQGVFLIADIGNKSTDLVVVEDGFVRVTHNLESITRELVVTEIERIVNLYKQSYNKNIEQCILAGGTILAGQAGSISESLAKDWIEILKERLRLEVKVGDPLERIIYPTALKAKLAELGPALAVAIGLAMREL